MTKLSRYSTLCHLSFGLKTRMSLGTYGALTCRNNASIYRVRQARFSSHCIDHTLRYIPKVDMRLYKLR